MFQSEDRNSLNVNENLTHKKRCMTIVLYHYLSGGQIPQNITIGTVLPSSKTSTQVIKLRNCSILLVR